MPLNTELFVQAYAMKPEDPFTRADLTYLRRYVDYKRMCWEWFSHIKHRDVTTEFQDALAKCWWVLGSSNHEYRAFIDLATLERFGVIHSMDVNAANAFLTNAVVGNWLLRHTTKNWSMKQAQVFTMSIKTLEGVKHERYVWIHGVGVVMYNGETQFKTMKEMFPDIHDINVVYATPFDAVQHLVTLYGRSKMVLNTL